MNFAEFQEAVSLWMRATFSKPIVFDRVERGDRALEELLELLQSHDYPFERIPMLVEYVRNRPKGSPNQELGGVLITLAAYANATYLSMDIAAHMELLNVWQKQELIREKQKSKPKDSPLPIPQKIELPEYTSDIAAAFDAYVLSCQGHSPLARTGTARMPVNFLWFEAWEAIRRVFTPE